LENGKLTPTVFEGELYITAIDAQGNLSGTVFGKHTKS